MDNVFNRVARRRNKGQGGFTLIELLVVIAVLAVLALIVLFNVVGVANKGRTASCNTDKGTIQTAVDAYYNDFTGYPDSTKGADQNPAISGDTVDTAKLQTKGYIHSIPDPTNDGAVTYSSTTGDVAFGKC